MGLIELLSYIVIFGIIFGLLVWTYILLSTLVVRVSNAWKWGRRSFSLSVDILDPEALYTVSQYLTWFDIDVRSKIMTRDEGIHLEVTYVSSYAVHHVFIKRLLILDGLGKILVV